MKIACKTPDCPRIGATRGLCRSCQIRRSREVKEGKTTWTELEAKGLSVPAKRRMHGRFVNG